jgi:hypothetical protein
MVAGVVPGNSPEQMSHFQCKPLAAAAAEVVTKKGMCNPSSSSSNKFVFSYKKTSSAFKAPGASFTCITCLHAPSSTETIITKRHSHSQRSTQSSSQPNHWAEPVDGSNTDNDPVMQHQHHKTS